MMARDPFTESDFRRCVDFHGHICPGLAIGYRAAMAGLDRLKETRAADEELLAIVETDACGADAIQVLTGCTFGKGNFIYKDYGKHVYTLVGRKTGRGIRIALKPGVMELSERHRLLVTRSQTEELTAEERDEFWQLHQQKSGEVLKKPLEDLFFIKPAHPSIPPRAKMEPSRPCSRCGETTMGSKLERFQGSDLCRDCFGSIER